MRRIDAIGIGLALLLGGWLLYFGLGKLGYDSIDAGIWSQGLMVVLLLGWVATYLVRVGTQNMTYSQQRRDYEQALLQKQLESMTPEELAQLQAEVEAEKAAKAAKAAQPSPNPAQTSPDPTE